MATLSLCIICKNEINHLPRLLKSLEGVFDEIHVTDTGSTDGTLEWLDAQPGIKVHQFKWIEDFGAARNYAFSHATTDYSMWLDCDDEVDDVRALKSWKQTILPTAEYWLATYHYGLDENGTPICSFMRERVIKNGLGLKWRYFIHEGIPPVMEGGKAAKISYASSWSVRHVRTPADMNADRNRNLSIFEKRKNELDDRLEYYYGKELFEANKQLEAYQQLNKAKDLNLEPHDKALCIQYAAMAAMCCNQFDRAIELAQQGLRLMPNRAEFYCIVGDCYLKLNQFDNAIPAYAAATRCINAAPNNATFQSPIFTQAILYQHYPRNQMARVYFNRGDFENAKKCLEEAMLFGANVETGTLYAELTKVSTAVTVKPLFTLNKVDEYVITCPQVAMYKWDEEVAKTRGIGGSETAAIRMARELHKATGKVVRVFNERDSITEIDGVFYHPHSSARDYFSQSFPLAHIAWRHNVHLTEAPTYLWCHDLTCGEIDRNERFEKALALSEFHKDYLRHVFKVPEDKILITRNGIDLERFAGVDFGTKNPNKIVFSSSPDRGLDHAIYVVDALRAGTGIDAELHAFYGFDNMTKLGLHSEVARYKKLIAERPWVKFHGNVQQNDLVGELKDAKIWLYPTDFLETFCITALEMLACRVTPVVRKHGALPFTLKDLPAKVIDLAHTDYKGWAAVAEVALKEEQPVIDMTPYTWESVAKDWLTWLPATHS